MKTKEEAQALADQRNARLPDGAPPFKVYLNKRSTHTAVEMTMVDAATEEPLLDENGNPKKKLVWRGLKDAVAEYIITQKPLEHHIAVALFLFGVCMTFASLFFDFGGSEYVVLAVTGTGLYDPFIKNLLDPSGSYGDFADFNTDVCGLLGISPTGEGAADEVNDSNLADTPYLSGNRAHGPTVLTVSVTSPVQLTWRVDATDLSGTFLDNNGVNDTSCLIFYWEQAAADATRYTIWYSVLAADVPQDGTNDNVTFNASGLFQIAG